jgi:hypothetical protein
MFSVNLKLIKYRAHTIEDKMNVTTILFNLEIPIDYLRFLTV